MLMNLVTRGGTWEAEDDRCRRGQRSMGIPRHATSFSDTFATMTFPRRNILENQNVNGRFFCRAFKIPWNWKRRRADFRGIVITDNLGLVDRGTCRKLLSRVRILVQSNRRVNLDFCYLDRWLAFFTWYGGVAELADALDSKSSGITPVEVRVLSPLSPRSSPHFFEGFLMGLTLDNPFQGRYIQQIVGAPNRCRPKSRVLR